MSCKRACTTINSSTGSPDVTAPPKRSLSMTTLIINIELVLTNDERLGQTTLRNQPLSPISIGHSGLAGLHEVYAPEAPCSACGHRRSPYLFLDPYTPICSVCADRL